ncbi:MAG: hypothetical protein AB4426_01995 [Xenococcaceae cyanobacterium]
MNKKISSYLGEAFRGENGTDAQSISFLRLSIRIGVLLILYGALERLVMITGHLPQASYEQPVIFIELGKRIVRLFGMLLHGYSLFFLVTALLLVGFILTRYPSLRCHYHFLWHSWSVFDCSTELRLFITLVAGIMAWSFSTYDYNLFFNQGHYLDRVLLIVLVLLIYWRPVFVFPFLFLLVSIVWQFTYPIGGYSWAEKQLLVRILILFMATFLLYGATGSRKIADFLFFVCCLFASHYLAPGLGKIQLNWLAQDRIYFLMPNTYANGWLAFLEPGTIATLTKTLSLFNWPMKVSTLLLECGALFCLWRRTALRFFLMGWIAFHLGIFFVSGICFWQWMVLEACLLLLFFRKGQVPSMPIFTRRHFVLSIALIITVTVLSKPVALSWLDARVTYTYRFEALGESGKRYALPPRFFMPYDFQFTLSGFHYLAQPPHLSILWGATGDRALADALVRSKSSEEIEALELERGTSYFNSYQTAQFDNFIKQFIGNLNLRRSKDTWLSALQAPPQLWTFSKDDPFKGQERIVRVIVYQILSLYDDEQYLEIRKNLVCEIEIP